MPSTATFTFSPQRLRSYVLRLPLCTRILLAVIVAFWVAGISHGFQNWAQLTPNEVFAGSSRLQYPLIAWCDRLLKVCTVHRLNTYPFLHVGLLHMLSNVVALTPLLERFESENGTLVTLILFTGRMSIFFRSFRPSLIMYYSLLHLPSWPLPLPGEVRLPEQHACRGRKHMDIPPPLRPSPAVLAYTAVPPNPPTRLPPTFLSHPSFRYSDNFGHLDLRPLHHTRLSANFHAGASLWRFDWLSVGIRLHQVSSTS